MMIMVIGAFLVGWSITARKFHGNLSAFMIFFAGVALIILGATRQ